MAKVKHIAHLAFKVSELGRALDFYCGILGFEKKFELRLSQFAQIPPEEDRVMIVYVAINADEFVELFPAVPGQEKGVSDDDHVGYLHLSLETDDIRGMYSRCVEAGADVTSEVSLGADNTWQFWVRDPDGNRIEFMEYTEKSLQLR